MKYLIMVFILAVTGCSTTTFNLGACKTMCKDYTVESFKDDLSECKCQSNPEEESE